jgi:MSHA biogenesis protein MshN
MQVGRNELPEALQTMEKSLPYAAKQADYQAFLAALLQRQNRHAEAIGYFQNALKLNPQSGVWLMGLGISLRAEQRNSEAREAYNRALEVHNLSDELQAFVAQQLKEL